VLDLISVFQPRAGERDALALPTKQQPVQYHQQPQFVPQQPQFVPPQPQFVPPQSQFVPPQQQPAAFQAGVPPQPQPQFVTTLPAPPPGMVYGLVPIAGGAQPPGSATPAPTVEAPGSTPAASPAAGTPPPPAQQQQQDAVAVQQQDAVAVQQQPVEPQPGAQQTVHQVNDLYEDAPEPR
jgi:hypothetical protein